MRTKRKTTKTATPKPTDEEKLVAYMNELVHPLKAEIQALRIIIKGAHPGIKERIKWNAPSYYIVDDIVTFNHRMTDRVHLIFHHPAIDTITSPLWEGEYTGRRMAYFTDMKAIKAGKKEILRIISLLAG